MKLFKRQGRNFPKRLSKNAVTLRRFKLSTTLLRKSLRMRSNLPMMQKNAYACICYGKNLCSFLNYREGILKSFSKNSVSLEALYSMPHYFEMFFGCWVTYQWWIKMLMLVFTMAKMYAPFQTSGNKCSNF